MAGNAKTNQVVLSTATVMLGPVADLHKFTPALHSIGLVKNFTATRETEQKELTQGVTNQIVFSMQTGETVRATMEVYEYTARNIAYSAGLDATGVAYDPISAIYTTTTAPSGTTVALSAAPTGIVAGDYIFIQSGLDDLTHLAKVASIATNTITLAATHAIPAGMTFAAGSRVSKVIEISTGVDKPQATLACKVVGILPADNTPVTLIFPKIKVTRGFNLAFTSNDFSNMPFEFSAYSSAMTDTHYAEFGTAPFKYFTR